RSEHEGTKTKAENLLNHQAHQEHQEVNARLRETVYTASSRRQFRCRSPDCGQESRCFGFSCLVSRRWFGLPCCPWCSWWRSASYLLRGPAAVGQDVVAGHEGRRLGADEQRQLADLLRFAPARHRRG